jgi:hypothetical protein
MHKLFYELLQVAAGQLDCLSRGPSPEEWQSLHDTAVRQQLTAVAYRGVEKLFEFGLRAPQDLAIDWMAEAEEAPDYIDGELQLPLCPAVSINEYIGAGGRRASANPLTNWRLKRWFNEIVYRTQSQQVYTSLSSSTLRVFLLVMQLRQEFRKGPINLRQLTDLFFLLKEANGRLEPFPNGTTLQQALFSFRLWRFSQGLMWVLKETFALERKLMTGEPKEREGRFILHDTMADRRHTWYYVRHFPLSMLLC